MLRHPLTNFEIQKCYQNELKFNGIYSRTNLFKIKDGAYITNLHEYESLGAHQATLCVNAEDVTYFGSFGLKHIPEKT